MARSVTDSRSSVVSESLSAMRPSKRKRKKGSSKTPSKRMSKNVYSKPYERSAGEQLTVDVLSTAHEATRGAKGAGKILSGAVSGALAGAQIGEAIKKYKHRKRKEKVSDGVERRDRNSQTRPSPGP